MIHKQIEYKIQQLSENAKILDAGGWFKPYYAATHVVDLMPWETRETKLQTEQLSHEKFSKQTWHQCNFLDPKLRLPFEDKYFDFSICSHTLEDLENPQYLLQELLRVSKSGYIEVPSRLAEQTIAIEDGFSDSLGWFHHHYIIEAKDQLLIFHKKIESINQSLNACAVPLITYRRITAQNEEKGIVNLFWKRTFDFKFESASISQERAAQFKLSLNITRKESYTDFFFRRGRKIRNFARSFGQSSPLDWWSEIVTKSQPYSSLPLD